MLGIKLVDDSTSFDHTLKTFSGVYFILRGFDFVSEHEVRSKLVSSGGIDVGQYGPTCTHVIVHKLVYDDPICITARADGKMLVTGLWVDHSFDVGMPVDPNSVMYTPLHGKDGIPGSESLIVCLTGYQRQDREDIMIMVGLMGAKFSKPLVANKVTHLVCYKFEGEKYDLAKKMKRIKLINHRWLEDCLKAWTILPEADYYKSGYELEMMEAEAKDSEEEDADLEPCTKQSVDIKNVATPNNLTIKASLAPQSKENFSRNLPTSSAFRGLLHTTTSDATLSAGQEESSFMRTLTIQELDKRNIQDFNCDEPYLKFPTPTKEANNLADHCDASRSNSASVLRNTMAENTLPVFKGGSRSNSRLRLDEDKANISDGFEASFFREEVSNVGSKNGLVRSPTKEKESPLSGKEKLILSFGKSKSPEIDCDLQTCNSGSPSPSLSKVIKGSVSATSIKAGVDKNASPTSIYSSPDNSANASPSNMLKETISELEQKSLSKSDSKLDEPCPFFEELKNKDLFIEHGNDNIVSDPEFVSIDCGKRPDPQDSFPEAKSLGVDKFISPTLDTLKGNDCDTFGKPVQKKTIPKRNWKLGSRPKVGLSKVKNQKGSIYLSDDVSASTSENNNSEQAEKLPPSLFLDKGIGMETNNVVNPMNEQVDTVEYMDDETEPPEDKQEDQLNVVFRERDQETSEVNLETKDKSECTIPGTTSADDIADGTVCLDEVVDKSENEDICWKNLIESVGKTNSVKLVSGKRKSNEGVNREDFEYKQQNQKMGLNKDESSPSPIAKSEGILSLEKTDISKKVGKEKILTTKNERKTVQLVGKRSSKNGVSREDLKNKRNQKMGMNKEKSGPSLIAIEKTRPMENADTSTEVRKENTPIVKETSGPLVLGKRVSNEKVSKEDSENKRKNQKMELNKEKRSPSPIFEIESTSLEITNISTEVGKKKRPVGKTKSVQLVSEKRKSNEDVTKEEPENKRNNVEKCNPVMTAKIKTTPKSNEAKRSIKAKHSIEVEKENRPLDISDPNVGQRIAKTASNIKKAPAKIWLKDGVTDQDSVLGNLIIEPRWFILTGHKLQRKECQQVIKRLRGRVCRDSHKWSYQATHLIYPDPLRRTEKFFAAAASGRWILKTDYLATCNQEGKFLVEEPYEWHKKGLSEDGMINLEAPRKWRLLREKTGHGALHGMRVIIYGDCIAPSLDTLKSVIKAGDGTILATSPPYTRFLNSNVDYAIVSPGMPRVDIWVQEFLRHEIPCVVADYLVEYVCKPGYPLERHVQYNTQAWAERSNTNLQIRSQEVILDNETSGEDVSEDVMCEICGSGERGEVMLICGDEIGNLGCGVGSHIDCCDPPLLGIPDEDWFCSKCSKSKKVKDSSRSTKKGRLSKRK